MFLFDWNNFTLPVRITDLDNIFIRFGTKLYKQVLGWALIMQSSYCFVIKEVILSSFA